MTNGYQDRNGVWRTDERSDEEKRDDAIRALFWIVFGGPFLFVVACVLVWVLA